MDENEILRDDARRAAEWLCKALEQQLPAGAVECIWFALANLPDCGHDKQKLAKAAIAEKYGFKG